MEKLPEERRNALFASIPDGFELDAHILDKFEFWKRQIESLIENGKTSRLVISSKDLHLKFQVNGVVPLCIDEVLQWMIKEQALELKSSFALEKSVLTSIWNWGVSMIVPGRPLSTKDAVDLVSVPLVKLYAERALEAIDRKDHLMDRVSFDKICESVGIESASDVKLIIQYLITTKQLKHKVHSSIDALKFLESEEISDTDFGILKIKKTVRTLQLQIFELESKIHNTKLEARKLVSESKKPRALYQLKTAKHLEVILNQRLSSLDTLDNILFKIANSKTDLEIVSAYDVGTKTLKEILNKKELQYDNVTDTMDALAEVLEDHNEIENAMAIDNGLDGDLEMELEALVAADNISATFSSGSLLANTSEIETPIYNENKTDTENNQKTAEELHDILKDLKISNSPLKNNSISAPEMEIAE